MKTRARASYAQAAENHLCDALHESHAARWRWLQQAMAFGFDLAKARAARGLVTLGPHGEVIWSALHAELFAAEQRLPSEAELAHLS
ncbi:MAG: hypothetical protein ABIP49_04445 [Lysobacterales bacterium]